MPCWSIGLFGDFQMRASIMPLALVALAFADWASRIDQRSARRKFLVIVMLGSVTGAVEIAQAFSFAPSPVPHCSLPGVWNRQSTRTAPNAAYFVARDEAGLKVDPVERVSDSHPASCWDRPWKTPRGAIAGHQVNP